MDLRAGALASRLREVYEDIGRTAVLIWGKWDGVEAPLPLLAHAIDTGMVATCAWDHLGAGIRRNATSMLAPGNEALAQARFAFLAGLHDIGKAEASFQGQVWSREAVKFATHRPALVAAGFPMNVPEHRPKLPGMQGLWLRHEAASGVVLDELTGLPAWARRIVMGHHGRYQPTFQDSDPHPALREHRDRLLAPRWMAVQQQILTTVVDVIADLTGLTIAYDDWPVVLSKRMRAFLVPLSGLVSVCDWIASDTAGGRDAFVRSAPTSVLDKRGPVAYARTRKPMAAAALDGVLARPSSPIGTFADLFADRQARGVQMWAMARQHGPGLAIVCAGMGEGKTECALTRHVLDSATAGAGAGDGLYFALPTMATADSMFERVLKFWEGTRGTGHLAHSQAILSDFFAPTTVSPSGVCDDDQNDRHMNGREGLTPASWFQGRHRALLAPVTVGTQDQVLAAALRHKYVTVRHAGLAGKHLILDEVHTYDPYQNALLVRLLEWLGAYRCRVTLLSATLPRARVVEMVEAYTRGWYEDPAADVVGAATAQVPDPLPYPAVTVVDDTVTVEPQHPWRRFTISLATHTLPHDKDAYETQAASTVAQIRARQPNARIGVIVNVVDRAIAVYEHLRDDPAHGQTVLLHSRMTYAQRTDRTKQVHDLVGETAPAGPVLVVATQVAEASLDLDFDILVTDLAPIASLWQRAGRMWRHSINTGNGWTHPPHLAYRTDNPVLHVLVPVDDDGAFVARGSLPYLAAELRKTWQSPACLDRGARTEFAAPEDMQPSVDAGNVSWRDVTQDDSDESREILRALGEQIAKLTELQNVDMPIKAVLGTWKDTDSPDPWRRHGPDWSALTEPLLWDDAAVTRLQDLEQARIVVCDPTGGTRWAWPGNPTELADPRLDRSVLLQALGAIVPISGRLARAARTHGLPLLPDQWPRLAPTLLRDAIPLLITDLAVFAALDPDLGLIRTETHENCCA
jgi:CRISPR-associated endonuclease/helicase Cas3